VYPMETLKINEAKYKTVWVVIREEESGDEG